MFMSNDFDDSGRKSAAHPVDALPPSGQARPAQTEQDATHLCAYVRADPINFTDPLGLGSADIQVCGGGYFNSHGVCTSWPSFAAGGGAAGSSGGFGNLSGDPRPERPPREPREPPEAQCPTVPAPGPGKAQLDKNIREAASDAKVNSLDLFSPEIGGLNLSNVTNFVAKVAPYSSQDYKVRISGSATFGNFNYGAVGAAYGFSLRTLLGRAANVQTFMDAIKLKGIRP